MRRLWLFWASVAVMVTLCGDTFTARAADYVVSVSCRQTTSQTNVMQGFLHGFALDQSPDPVLVGKNLIPRFWRLGIEGWKRLPKVTAFNPKITMNVSDLYAEKVGGHSNAKPWLDWSAWESFCADQAHLCLANSSKVDYWDLWSEPDTSAMWRGTWPQLLETYQRGRQAIRSVIPEARFVGPGTTEFAHPFDCEKSKGLMDFLRELSLPPYGVRFEAVSWHELGAMPSSMPRHAETLRSFLADPATFSPPYVAELHVNEYGAPSTAQIPAWTVGWLHYAEEARLDWLSRACWTMWEDSWPFRRAWSNCTNGMEGLFLRDLTTPQQVYFVHWAYACLNTGARISVSSSNSDVNGLAARYDGDKSLCVLIGLYNRPFPSSVEVLFRDYPWECASVDVIAARFSNDNVLDSNGNPRAQAGTGPRITRRTRQEVTQGSVTVSIDPYCNGDMYCVVISPHDATATNGGPKASLWATMISDMMSVTSK